MKIVKINEFFTFKEKTYNDKVIDHIISIICDENHISEKSFREVDTVIDMVKNFMLNINLNDLIETFEYNECRYQFCAEIIYDEYFHTLSVITESIKNQDDVESSVKNSKTLPKEIKEQILPLLTSESKYLKGRVYDLMKPHGSATKIGNLSLNMDKNGFFVSTHRARSKSYPMIDQIPSKEIIFIKTTA